MLYRKSIMEKMQSPDQLDQVQEVAGPMNILAIIGGLIVVAAAIVYFVISI